MMRSISRTFPSVKLRNPNPNPQKFPKSQDLPTQISSSSSSPRSPNSKSAIKSRSWCVYLILSTNKPIKTYVGVTTDFSRRLKQHNGEIRGGAKASCAGRPWLCACIVHGFNGQSEASSFESNWKSISRKLPRKQKNRDTLEQSDDGSHALLQHRKTALDKAMEALQWQHLVSDGDCH
ncbi:PREDICTED: structure-specific endonuclease subunit slx1-like [Tarenaya hassleriana]|uniref:structure-specific endonuclease subunit slx1-like n=1 Tax=Tarenaya hassleriana TaxID=28532 RepID=UPI00053C38E8|nr:PREDICTED: structure-specific endonuclease subunit slx1-like [Tarenaya hassleriana]